MNKCFYSSTIVLVTLITAIAPKDICELCLPISKCKLFARMGRADQESWMNKYPCNNHHSDDYGTPPGSRASDQGNLVCCPNQVWGIESKDNPSERLTDTNRFGNPQDTSNIPDTSNAQKEYPYTPNNNNDKQNQGNNYGYYNNGNPQSPGSLRPSRWPQGTQNMYWNDRPDRTQWDIGNKNYYQGNNRRDFDNNNKRNDNNNRGDNNSNNQGFRPNPPDYNYNSRPAYNPYFPRPPGNSFGEEGQCDRLTRFPPNPQSGCCGREASDDDRITGTPFKINANNEVETKLTKNIDDAPSFGRTFAPAFNRYLASQNPPDYDWSYSMFNEKENVTKGHIIKRSTNSTAYNTTSFVKIENRISGGKETSLTQYPWTVLLVTVFENSFQRTAFNCGGSLISSKFVLTAGHCVFDAEAAIKSVQVFLAEFDKRTFPMDCKITGSGEKCIENLSVYAEDVIRHPRFDETRLQNDIALIKLQSDVPYTEYIRPICLPSINIDNPEHARLLLTVAGWGRNGQYKSDIKQSTAVHLVPQHDCKKFYPDLTRRHLCAAGYTGEDTCKGDSGGPLMVLYRGKYYVVGVVSGKRTDAPCGSSVPSLYTNVYHYLDWIRSNIQNSSGVFSDYATQL